MDGKRGGRLQMNPPVRHGFDTPSPTVNREIFQGFIFDGREWGGVAKYAF